MSTTTQVYTWTVRFSGDPKELHDEVTRAAREFSQDLAVIRTVSVQVVHAGTGETLASLAPTPAGPGRGQVEHRINGPAPGGRFEVYCDFAEDTTITNQFEGIQWCPFCGQIVEQPVDPQL